MKSPNQLRHERNQIVEQTPFLQWKDNQLSCDSTHPEYTSAKATSAIDKINAINKLLGAYQSELENYGSENDGFPASHPHAHRASLLNVVASIANGTPMRGLEAEVMQQAKVPMNHVPLDLIFGSERGDFMNTAVSIDTLHSQPQGFGGVVRARTLAGHLGLSPRGVGSGVAAYPIITSGAGSAEVAKDTAATASTFAVGSSDLKPKRHVSFIKFNQEDAHRLGSEYEYALRNDMSDAIMSGLDNEVLKAIRTDGDVGESALTQENKVKIEKVLEILAGKVDGQYAWGADDIRTVLSKGAYALWMATDSQATGDWQSMERVVREAGFNFRVGGFEAATTNGKFGAYATLGQKLPESYAWPVWQSAQVVVDSYSEAESGVVRLIVTTFWNFAVIRAGNFFRVKFTT